MEDKRINSTEETEKNINSQEVDGQASLDALLFDGDDDAPFNDNTGEKVEYEAFMKEYRSILSKNIADAAEAEREKREEEAEREFLVSPPKKASQKKKAKSNEIKKSEASGEWDEAITLEPADYTDPSEEDKIFHDEVCEEIEDSPTDFDLGEAGDGSDDKFQISINFAGEQKDEVPEETEKEYTYDPEKPRAIDWIFDIAEMFVFVLVAVMILTSFLFKHSIVEGDSMRNTLEDGDHLIISDLFYTPERGDIVVFEDYSTSLKKAVVKRVIGLPGDTVEVRLNEAGEYEVYIDGVYLEEEYALNEIDFTSPGVGTWTVGEGEIFVLGDNRYNSTDSRDGRVGTIDIDCILGKVLFRFLPFDKFGAVE